MQFTIDAKRLKAALGKVKRATDRKPTMPILESVVCHAYENVILPPRLSRYSLKGIGIVGPVLGSV
jgi:hypothetical protein